MIIRNIESSDLAKLKKIHEKFYNKQFDFPNFFNNFIGTFVITDDEENIITVAGVRAIAESVIMTNKDATSFARAKALYKVLEVSSFICRNSGFDQLHGFIQDEEWKHKLIKAGFTTCNGDALYLNV